MQRVMHTHMMTERVRFGWNICRPALKGPDGQLAAISMPVPTSRFEESEAVLVRALVAHCSKFQERIGR